MTSNWGPWWFFSRESNHATGPLSGTWYVAREKAGAILGVHPEKLRWSKSRTPEDLTVVVRGTSIGDDGVRTEDDVEEVVISGSYVETTRKWIAIDSEDEGSKDGSADDQDHEQGSSSE